MAELLLVRGSLAQEQVDVRVPLCLAFSAAAAAWEIAVSCCSYVLMSVSSWYCACSWHEEPRGSMLKGSSGSQSVLGSLMKPSVWSHPSPKQAPRCLNREMSPYTFRKWANWQRLGTSGSLNSFQHLCQREKNLCFRRMFFLQLLWVVTCLPFP